MNDQAQRSLAIDVMRGVTLALMIVVNMAIDDDRSYAQLLHSVWDGFTLTDAVFPAFLFSVGSSLAIVMHRQRLSGDAAFRARILRRTVGLFVIGYLLSWAPFFKYDPVAHSLVFIDLAHTRILGVLQRIALTYGLTALWVHRFGTRGAWLLLVGVLALYPWLLSMTGEMTLEGNGERALDLYLFGADHLYHGEGIPFDPEGVLSTVPALANVLGGYLAGRWVSENGATYRPRLQLALVSVLIVFAAMAWSHLLPFNKKLWTSSYALLNLGIDGLVLAVLSYGLDVVGVRPATGIFATLGRNTLAVYLFSEIGNLALSRTYIGESTTFEWIHAHLFAPWAGLKFGSLLYCLSYLLLCWLFARALAIRHIQFRL